MEKTLARKYFPYSPIVFQKLRKRGDVIVYKFEFKLSPCADQNHNLNVF